MPVFFLCAFQRLYLDQALFDAHFKISITSQWERIDGGIPDHGGGRSFQSLPGEHFQGDCKSKMTQLLYGDVMRLARCE